jgi:hypothetical protein
MKIQEIAKIWWFLVVNWIDWNSLRDRNRLLRLVLDLVWILLKFIIQKAWIEFQSDMFLWFLIDFTRIEESSSILLYDFLPYFLHPHPLPILIFLTLPFKHTPNTINFYPLPQFLSKNTLIFIKNFQQSSKSCLLFFNTFYYL